MLNPTPRTSCATLESASVCECFPLSWPYNARALSKAPRHYAEALGFALSCRGTSDKALALYVNLRGVQYFALSS